MTTQFPYTLLANGTAGQLITWSAAGVASTVPTGTAGQVLTSNGAGAAPTMQTPSGGGTAADIQTFTSSGTWTKPAGTPKQVRVQTWGGGGSGASRATILP